jgi:hypothetical protein
MEMRQQFTLLCLEMALLMIQVQKVKITTTSYEKQHVVMPCIIADGLKLPPYIILKCKMTPKNEMFPKDVTVCALKWLDDN